MVFVKIIDVQFVDFLINSTLNSMVVERRGNQPPQDRRIPPSTVVDCQRSCVNHLLEFCHRPSWDRLHLHMTIINHKNNRVFTYHYSLFNEIRFQFRGSIFKFIWFSLVYEICATCLIGSCVSLSNSYDKKKFINYENNF